MQKHEDIIGQRKHKEKDPSPKEDLKALDMVKKEFYVLIMGQHPLLGREDLDFQI